MGRIGVSYEEVAKVAAELQGRGQNLTIDNIRAVLGTGSKSTLARHLKEWKQQVGVNSTLEASLPSDLLALVKGLWERLQQTAENQIEEYQREADVTLREMEAQVNTANQVQHELQKQLYIVQEQLQTQTHTSERLQHQLISEQREKSKITEQATSLETRRKEDAKEMERLHQLLNHVQNNLEHFQSSTERLRQEQTLLLEQQRQENETKLIHLQQQLTQLTQEKSHFETLAQQHHDAKTKLEQQHQMLDQKFDALKKEHGALSVNYQSLIKSEKQLSKFSSQQTNQLEEKNHVIIELQTTLKVSDENLASLKQVLSKAEDKINSLRDDVDFARQEKANLMGQLQVLENIIPEKSLVD